MKRARSIEEYRDIIDLPHPDSKTHPRMSIQNRAAQFAPFAAVTGYDDAVKQTGVLHEEAVANELEKERIEE